ncbi:MAG: fatty acid desaturase [Proteobacteria bacterium]|nr:fatty acid desaturase [Pseudomonadota bacterium]
MNAPSAPAVTATVRPAAIEIPTVLLTLVVYAAWLFLTYNWARWPLFIVAPLMAVILTLHSSLQHETVHGHPTRWPAVNRLLVILPLSFWLPFDRYLYSHRVHHRDERLTDPLDDPESFYWTPEDWARLSSLHRLSLRVQQTLAGRILFGSFWFIGVFLRSEVRALRRNEPGVRRIWAQHLLWCLPVVVWIKAVCGMPLWIYVLTMVVPSYGILLIRSYPEHRARPAVRARVAVVEGSWILGPLFLFNNLHSLHHEAPMIPWYQLPRRYREQRERLLAENGGLVYYTYFAVARRYLFRAHDVLQHPLGRIAP